MEVKSLDAMEHLEQPDWKKLSRTYPSMFVPTDTYIKKSLDLIPIYHSMVGGINVQDKLERLWRGDIIRNKMKQTVGDQEVPVPKGFIFDCKQTMFVGVHPAFEQKLEISKYGNSMTPVSMVIEKYQWNFMVAGETEDLDDSYFSSNLLFLVETQTMYMDFQVEL